MNQAIQIIQSDMKAYSLSGHNINDYQDDHVLAVLIAADIDPMALPHAPSVLRDLAIIDRLKKALEQ